MINPISKCNKNSAFICPPIPLQLSLKIGYVLLHFCIVAYFATTGGGVRELTNALPESIYTSSLSKGGFKLPPLLNVLATAHLDAPPYTVQYISVLLIYLPQ